MIKNSILFILLFTLASCYSTKHIQSDQYVLKKNTIVIYDETNIRKEGITKKDIHDIIKQKPNKKIIGFIPFHLWLYNLSKPKNENWANSYLRKIGESPAILDTELVEKSKRQIKSYFENNGYFTASVTTDIIHDNNKARVNYLVKPGKSFLIQDINYKNIHKKDIYNLIKSKKAKLDMKSGDLFTYNNVNNERILIEKILKNNGYYKFSNELIYVNADSTQGNKINLNFLLKTTNIDSSVYEKFSIENIFIHIDKVENGNTKILKDHNFIFAKEPKHNLKLEIISELINIKKNQLYSQKDIEETYRNLSNLNFFKQIQIEFFELDQSNKLNCIISLESPTKMYYSIEGEIKRSADEGNLGISSYLQFGNNNLLGGAENLNGKIKISLENRQTNIEQNTTLFNTREISYELKLRVPKLIIPELITEKITKSFQMNTNFVFSFTKRERPDFSSQVVTQKLGYSWHPNDKIIHQLNLIELSYSDIGEINSFIQNELIENPYLSEQFEDKFIPATNYIFTFNNQKIYKISNYTYFRTKAEFSGNMFSIIGPVLNLKQNNDNNYMLFNNPFSQYIRLEADFRRYIMFSKENILVLRGFYGLGYSYNNSDELPIQKQFFSGGVNSIRAWEAFGLGPGSVTTQNNYSTGDIKLELNFEYRFRLLNSLKSAFFIDAGNIWSIKNDPREGSIFKFNQFANDIAIGIGTGFRYDFDFFVIRMDIATPLRDPSREKRWIEDPLNGNFRYNLAIGYPF